MLLCMRSGLLSCGLVYILLLFTSRCSAIAGDESYLNFNANDNDNDIDALLLGPQLPVLIQPHGGHTLDDEFFKPSHSIDYFSSTVYKGSLQLHRVTLKHDNHPYIHLDPIEAALTRPVECRPDAKVGYKTDLTLEFSTEEFFARAQRHWNPSPESPLHFVVEGPHCFQAGGDRSVYISTEVRFFVEEKKVVIVAEPLHTHIAADTHWASEFSIQSHDLPEGHIVVPRASAGNLHKRNFPDLKTSWSHAFEDEQWGPRHEFFTKGKAKFDQYLKVPSFNVTCIECHTRGKIKFEFHLDFDLRPWKHGRPSCDGPSKLSKRSTKAASFLTEHDEIQSKVAVAIEAERIARHKEAHSELRKRGEPLPRPFQWLSCPESDPTYPVCHDVKIDEQKPEDCWKQNVFLTPTHALPEAGKCLLHTIGGHPDCWKQFKHDAEQFDSLSQYVVAFIRAHVNNLEIQFVVEEDLDLRFQLELLTKLDAGVWFDLDVFPYDITNPFHQIQRGHLPNTGIPYVEASAGWYVRTASIGSPLRQDVWSKKIGERPMNPSTGDPVFKKYGAYNAAGQEKVDGWRSLPAEMKKTSMSPLHGLGLIVFDVVPLTISASLNFHVSVNMTSPGLNVKMTKGRMVLRPLDEDRSKRYSNTIYVDVDYKKAALEIGEDWEVMFKIAIGPRVKFDLFPVSSPGPLAKISDNVASGGFGLGKPLAFGAHLQPVRMDIILKGAPANDKDCVGRSANGDFANGGVKLEFLLRTGLDAFAASFSQRIDTSFLEILHHSDVDSEGIAGLWFSKRLAHICHEWSSSNGDPSDGINGLIAKILNKVQEPVQEFFDKLGPFLSASSELDPSQERFRSWNANSSTLSESLEYFQWHQNVVASDVVPPGVCQPEGVCDPNSEYYIPAGVTETLKNVLNDWYHAMGGQGDYTERNVSTPEEIWKSVLEYNSSTVVIPPSTSFTRPTSIYHDPRLPSEFQWVSDETTTRTTSTFATSLETSSIYSDLLSLWNWQSDNSGTVSTHSITTGETTPSPSDSSRHTKRQQTPVSTSTITAIRF